MKGLWWIGDDQNLCFKDLPEPIIEDPHDVKIQVAFSGICGSDIHFMSGSMGKMGAKADGVVLGHEFTGTVVEVGSENNFKVGDKVCVNPNNCCGKCRWSTDNLPQFCPNNIQVGVQSNGGWAQFCVVKDFMISKLPDQVTLQQGALGEPYSCVLRGWNRLEPLPDKESRVLVQGAGIIGTLFCSLLHLHGYKNVTVSELNESRRNLCRVGPSRLPVVLAQPDERLKQNKKKVQCVCMVRQTQHAWFIRTSGQTKAFLTGMNFHYDIVSPQEIDLMFSKKDVDIDGFHLVIDCTGNTIAVKKALELARRGGKVLVFGCCAAGKTIPFEPYQLFYKELTVLGSFINPFCFEDTMELLEKLAANNYLDYNKLGIKTFDLSQYEDALECLKKGEASKAMFKVEN